MPASLPAARPCRSTTARPAARSRRSRRASPRTSHYVVVAYESGGVVRTTVIAEDTAAPVAGTASLRVFDAATDAGAIDIYVTDPAVDITTLTSPTFTFALVDVVPGEQLPLVRARAPTACASPAAATPPTCASTCPRCPDEPAGRGAVLHADDRRHARQRCCSRQQGAYTAGRNTSARVRLRRRGGRAGRRSRDAGGVADRHQRRRACRSAAMSSFRPAARSTSASTALVAAPRRGAAAGSDSTLLVYGTPAAPTASLIADDNHLPTTSGNLKLRLLNGLTGAAVPLTSTRLRGHRQQRRARHGVAVRGGRLRARRCARRLLADEPDADLQRPGAQRARQRRLHALHARRRRDADSAPAPRPLSAARRAGVRFFAFSAPPG